MAGGSARAQARAGRLHGALPGLFGHGRARVAIHFNILIALVLLAASVVIARGGA